eukprot:TRINITY_DN41160_c0_g1_i1.p1 TRINITY_DN41160_c0_g1~~TRINITY_DN41160_c0_g1_i1.p1  ORF type:complete len:244 (-),score=20.96 TRINITY_DN41160_c0_g1_i1:65-796(-)
MPRNSIRVKQQKDKVRLLEAQGEHATSMPLLLSATFKPAMSRPCSQAWDWHNQCGYLVHAGRYRCPISEEHGRHGATMVASFRGQRRSTPQVAVDVRRQMATPQFPSDLASTRSGRHPTGQSSGAAATRAAHGDQQEQVSRPGLEESSAPVAPVAVAVGQPRVEEVAAADDDQEVVETIKPSPRALPAPSFKGGFCAVLASKIASKRGCASRKPGCKNKGPLRLKLKPSWSADNRWSVRRTTS